MPISILDSQTPIISCKASKATVEIIPEITMEIMDHRVELGNTNKEKVVS